MSIMLCQLFFSLTATFQAAFHNTLEMLLQLQTVLLPLLDIGGKSSWNHYQEK